jgi:phage RecT family recombinase
MSNDLAILENQLRPLSPKFSQVLAKVMPVERFTRTLIVSCERETKLLAADRQSLFNAAMTGAVLGLEADGATGQFFLLPFYMKKEQRTVVQPVIGYKGYNTLGARSGLTISGGVVREGDEFDYTEGSKAFVRHKKKLGGEANRRIIAAWATATASDRPATVKILSIDEILAIKAKSPRGGQPPWADDAIGFPAMAEKSAKRRLARDMPLNVFQSAARMEEAFEEQGEASYIHPDKGVIVGGEATWKAHPDWSNYNDTTPAAQDLIAPPSLEQEARMAAERGREALSAFCRRLTKTQYATMRAYLETLKPIVEAADNAD